MFLSVYTRDKIYYTNRRKEKKLRIIDMSTEIRKVKVEKIETAVYNLFLKSGKSPTEDVFCALKKAYETETGETAKKVLSQIIENKKISDEMDMPYCQDTGLSVVFIDIGQSVIVDGDIDTAVNRGVRRAYEDGYFRKSVADPISRINTGDNTPAVIHKNIVPGDKVTMSVMAKGFGSENMSRVKMLKPSEGVEGIVNFVCESVEIAGGRACPPVILGIGIGGTFEKASLIAKRQLLRELDDKNEDEQLDELEEEIMTAVNSLGIGAMGFKGDTYCIGVKIGKFATHIAGMPVAVNINCHAARHESMEI